MPVSSSDLIWALMMKPTNKSLCENIRKHYKSKHPFCLPTNLPSASIDFSQNAESLSSSSVVQDHPSEPRQWPSGNRK